MLNRLKPKSEFSRNVLTLMTGTTIAQAIPIAISPILTRIYTPEDFGVLALFVSISSIVGSIVNGRYELAIMLPKKDEDAINIFALGFIITVSISVLLLILILFFHDYFVALLNNENIGVWLYFIPVAVFFTGLFNILNYFNNRKKYYKDIANATIIKSIITAVIQLSIGLLKGGVSGLISGQLISQMFANMRLFKNIFKDKLLISKISKVKIIAVAKRYKDFPKFSMWSSLLNNGSFQIPIILIGSFFNSAIVGYYSMAYRITGMPSSLIGSSIGQVFFQESSKLKYNQEELKNITINTYKKLLFIALTPIMFLHVYGDILFSFIFGENWLIAGQYTQILSLWLMLTFITSPLSNIMTTLEKQKIVMLINIFIFITRLLVLVIGGLIIQDAYMTIILYTLIGIFINIGMLIYIFILTKINIFKNFIYIFKYISLIVIVFTIIRYFIFGNLGVYQ